MKYFWAMVAYIVAAMMHNPWWYVFYFLAGMAVWDLLKIMISLYLEPTEIDDIEFKYLSKK